MKKNQKTYLIIGGIIVAAYLLYRYWVSANTTTTATNPATQDAAATDFASLSGQEQGDVAALQSQFSQLSGQEQSDAQTLTAQEQGDISGLTGTVGALSSAVSNIAAPNLAPLQNQIAAIASGQQKINRALTAKITPHKGGAFYNYYIKVTGKKPPAQVQVNNAIYQNWKAGVPAVSKVVKATPKPKAKK